MKPHWGTSPDMSWGAALAIKTARLPSASEPSAIVRYPELKPLWPNQPPVGRSSAREVGRGRLLEPFGRQPEWGENEVGHGGCKRLALDAGQQRLEDRVTWGE
jgi:hypothetical protein